MLPKFLRALVKRRLMFLSVLLFAFSATVLAQPTSFPVGSTLRILQDSLDQPESKFDLVWFKLTVDKMVDPSVDIPATLSQLDAMARDLQGMLPPRATPEEKLNTLKKYIYEAGPWNSSRPFQYDLTDPMGNNIKNKLMSTYLTTRKGNCVSMPILFLFLGQKIGLNVTLAYAPNHIFIKYRDSSGAYFNIETTSGGNFSRDVWMRKIMPMTDRAIASGIYMRPLSKKESAISMLLLLNELFSNVNQAEKRRQISSLALKHSPRDIGAILYMMTSYQQELNELEKKYPTIPVNGNAQFSALYNSFAYWYQKAENLGWQPEN